MPYLWIMTDQETSDMQITDEQWRERLTPQQYATLRQGGTDRAFTGLLLNEKREGEYLCAGCGTALFHSQTKYDSGSGWPSFTDVMNEDQVVLITDHSLGMVRTEVKCGNCDGHLGHVFPDGPAENGLRYCINSSALTFDDD